MRTHFKLATLLLVCLTVSCKENIIFPKGGYDYPARKYSNTRDSLYQEFFMSYWCKAFNEPDLRIKSSNNLTLRLIYEPIFGKKTVITLTKSEIKIKEATRGNPYPDNDLSQLNFEEQKHFRYFLSYFSIQDKNENNATKRLIDSLTNASPNFFDPINFAKLLEKSAKVDTTPFQYKIKTIKISERKFRKIVDQINASGYWQLPFRVECDETYLDGYGFRLEANTSKKYNSVSLANCPKKSLQFSKACQAIIDAAQMSDKIILVARE